MFQKIFKSIKIFYYKRSLVKIIGNVKFWSKMIRGWQNKLTAYSITTSDMKISDLEMCKINGNIRFYTRRVEAWKLKIEDIVYELRRLGVDVKVEL